MNTFRTVLQVRNPAAVILQHFATENTCRITISGVTKVACVAGVKIAQLFFNSNGFTNRPVVFVSFVCSLPSVMCYSTNYRGM